MMSNNSSIFKSPFILQVESTPNPNSYKIIINHSFMGQEMWDCSNLQSATESYLASAIWSITDSKSNEIVDNVFFHDDMVVVHKKEEIEWDSVSTEILGAIHGHFASGSPLFKIQQNFKEEIDSDPEDEQIIELITQVMQDYIQPSVASHGGLVKLRGFRAGIVKIAMLGACTGCPSSTETLKEGIENILRFYVPTLESVELVD
jgi:Fe-S cluster biogenesis protein NfuA